ncbi:unnamed protein product, partial [Porites evermanni]
LSVVNTCLSITAFLGNALILVALHKDTSIHLPSKLLYRNLAITDLCVGIIVEPLYVAYMISVVNKRRDIRKCYFVFSVADNTDCNKRGQTSRFATGSQIQTSCNFEKNTFNCYWWLDCVRCRCIYTLSESSYFFIVPLYFNTICAYIKIFMSLPHNQIHGQNHVVQGQSSQVNTLNKARYRKAVYSALWVQVTLVICYLPYGIAVALTPQRGMHLSTYLALQFTATLVFLNSSLNPFLYCWKITEVRQAVKETLQQLHFCIN